LCKEADCFKHCALAESTKTTYRSQLRTFFRFCLYFGRPSLPADQDTLKGYIAFLARSLNPSSLPGYLNVIRILHVSAGLKNPFSGNWELDMIKRGVTRKLGRPPVQKLPITLAIMRKIFVLLDFSLASDLAFWAAALVAFYGLLRKNTLLPSCVGSDSLAFLLRKDVADFTVHSFMLVIRQTKTIQFGQRLLKIPFVSCLDEDVCPVSFLLKHVVGSPLPGDSPLFNYCEDGKVWSWTGASFVGYLKNCLNRVGFPEGSYSGHSFRRGGCSMCFEAGLSVTDIKLRGDWRSNSFEKYLYVPAEAIFMSAKVLADFAGKN
jgi:hypothetical protein